MRTIAIIGAGFCGTMAAAHLLRGGGVRVCLFDPSGSFGPGLAYSTRSAAHLLNVPVGRMSARADAPDDFLHWGAAHGHHWTGGTFAPRREYGRYLQDALNAAEALGRGSLERVPGDVTAVRERADGVQVEWRQRTGGAGDNASRAEVNYAPGKRGLDADAVVLALGNLPPAHPSPALAKLPAEFYAADPWAAGALDGIDPTGPVLLIGTGLTMFDIVLSLVERGHRGLIHAISRRGLMPQPHRASIRPPASHAPPADLDSWEPTALGMLRRVRAEVRHAGRRGIDWREVITSLRPVTPRLWGRMDGRERARFLRHVRPFWEIVRHRSAPSVDGQIQELIMSGRLRVEAARVTAACAAEGGGGGAEVRLRGRGSDRETALRVARVINCTGPATDCARVNSPLIGQLLGEGLALADPLGQGLVTDGIGRVVRASGAVSENVWLIGPMARGVAWEITAVPELREHAARVAEMVRAGAGIPASAR